MLKLEIFHDYIWPFAYNAAVWLDQVKKNGMELEISWKSFILDANKDGVDQELFWESSTDQQGRSMYAHKISKAALQQGRELFSRLNLNIYIYRHSGKRIRLDKYDELFLLKHNLYNFHIHQLVYEILNHLYD